MKLAALVYAALALACWAGAVVAQEAANPLRPVKAWASLTPQQQQLLQPLASQWQDMDGASREKWVALAAKYPTLGNEEQARLRSRVQDWSALSTAERQQAREGFQTAQRKPEAERQAKWAAYQQLTPEKRQALQDRGAQRQAEAAVRARVRPVSAASPVVAQVQPGVSTVLLSGRQALGPSPWLTPGSTPLRASWAQVDPATLMPRTAARSASAPASADLALPAAPRP